MINENVHFRFKLKSRKCEMPTICARKTRMILVYIRIQNKLLILPQNTVQTCACITEYIITHILGYIATQVMFSLAIILITRTYYWREAHAAIKYIDHRQQGLPHFIAVIKLAWRMSKLQEAKGAFHLGQLLLTKINFIPSSDNTYMPGKVWNWITYPFQNFSGATVDIWERISNCIPHYRMDEITYPCQEYGPQCPIY